jgi:tetratricopeptide (TPR) repeat protein
VQRFAVVVALSLMLAPPLRAAGRSDLEKAKEHAARAKMHYDLGEYQQAAREYILVYRIKPLPALLYNIAQSYRQAGKYELARQFYRSYQREAHDAERSAVVESAIADIDDILENQRRAKDRPPNGVLGTLSARTKPDPPVPQAARAVASPPGPQRSPAAKAPSSSAPSSSEPAKALTTQLAASTPRAVPDAAISAAPDFPVVTAKPFYKTWWFWTAAGVVVVGAGTAIALSAGGSAPPSTHLGSTPVF